MSDGLLSQEEIDALLNGIPEKPVISDSDKDLLGEIGNISMGSASTALSTILGKMVNITTPKVSITSLNEMKSTFEVPIVSLEVLYNGGIEGANLLLMKITDASVIADIMMGGSGEKKETTLSDMQISAVSEAMNQMIGSSATAMATMLNSAVNISPPTAEIWDTKSQQLSKYIKEDEQIVRISFKIVIENSLDSEIMLLLGLNTAKTIVNKMTGDIQAKQNTEEVNNSTVEQVIEQKPSAAAAMNNVNNEPKAATDAPVSVQKAMFSQLQDKNIKEKQNIDLILDVPLEISVVLGKAQKTIKEILEMGTGTLVQLDRLTEEPVDILVNGKKVAVGEVVVVDENFGVRITSIVSNNEKIKSLKNN